MVRLVGFACSYCGLPVRLAGDHRHPGYVVVDQLTFTRPRGDGLPNLGVLHRFCNRVSQTRRPDGGRILRRAWLGWATDQFEASRCERRYGTRHYERLGLHPSRVRTLGLYRKYWQIRKMRCASRAYNYYSG
ncbi:MAG TPA: hypothetical protein VJT49_21960 [Amycolatopsis sp.]|uniref:hypothetical protein n=1 Tax=Amycolatopsis sp. TaxID=37632 RepID=UPI002B49071C|nr:hypothetical protein [Amycolatopsis sp.]HKS47726.1 hypothetical protein [Amycolatopsis sp.]